VNRPEYRFNDGAADGAWFRLSDQLPSLFQAYFPA
jgi:hypothetical protein